MNLDTPNSNACHFCNKVFYSCDMEELETKGCLYKVKDHLVGISWFTTVNVCPSCLVKEGRKQQKAIEAMITELGKKQKLKDKS